MDRVAAARESLEAVQSLARQAKDAGPPCSDCRYRTLSGLCGSLAYAKMTFDPAKGSLAKSFSVPVSDARSEDGLCGPEGLLFEPQIAPVVVVKSLYAGLRIAWIAVGMTIFAAGVWVAIFY